MTTLSQIAVDGSYAGPPLQFDRIIVGLDGAATDLENADFISGTFANLTFFKSKFATKLTGSFFENVHFKSCYFDRVFMARTSWKNCSFDDSTLIPSFDDAVFEKCSFIGSTLKGLTWKYGGVRARFEECDFSRCTLLGLALRATRFQNCIVAGMTIEKCDLRGTKHNGEPLVNSA